MYYRAGSIDPIFHYIKGLDDQQISHQPTTLRYGLFTSKLLLSKEKYPYNLHIEF